MKKRIICACIASLLAVGTYAQSGTNSPYSQYGLGTLADASQGFSRGMNGAGLGLRRGNVANTLNPASYSSIDSLTMIFDMGLSGQITNFKEGDKSVNAQNANIEYAVGAFRLLPNVGMAFGLLPYSDVGYKYSSTQDNMTTTYNGEGGLRQVFLGMGWQVLPHLSVGANAGYLWGSLSRTVTGSSTSSVSALSKVFSATVNNFAIDFGLQWQQPLSKTDELTLGATVGLGHKLGADPTCVISSDDNNNAMVVENGLSLPMTYGVGLAWTHGRKLVVDGDFVLQKWGSLDFPGFNSASNTYSSMSGLLKDRIQMKLGADYVPYELSRKFINRVHYRAGIGYATPYYYINGKEGPKELSVSAGFGIPLQNAYNNRSVLNVSAQWVHTSAQDMIKENSFRINVGLTFNERWFAKWKIE